MHIYTCNYIYSSHGYNLTAKLLIHIFVSFFSISFLPSPLVSFFPPLAQTHSSFQLLSEVTGKSPGSIIEPHKELLIDMIPPRKHLLKHQPINTQIALMVRNPRERERKERYREIEKDHVLFFCW